MNKKSLISQLVLITLTFFIGCTKEAPPTQATTQEAAPPTAQTQTGAIKSIPNDAKPGMSPQSVVRLPFNINPEESQKAEIAKLEAKYGEKLQSARKAVSDALTIDQKKARAEASKKAREAGKMGKDLVDAMNNAVKLTPDQQQKLTKAQDELSSISKEMNKEMMALLTPAQKEEMKSKAAEMRKSNPNAFKATAPQKPQEKSAAKSAPPKTKF